MENENFKNLESAINIAGLKVALKLQFLITNNMSCLNKTMDGGVIDKFYQDNRNK